MEQPPNELKKAAQEESRLPLLKDFLFFLANNKKWWLLPILIVLIGLSLLMLLASTPLAPILYPFF